MNKAGFVTALQKDVAIVKLVRHSACSECGMCHHSGEEKEILIEASNPVGAQPGDYVLVDLESVEVIRAAFVFYVLPLIAMIAGVFITKAIWGYLHLGTSGDLVSALVGIMLMGVVFLIIRKNEPRLKKSGRYNSVITEICNKNNENN